MKDTVAIVGSHPRTRNEFDFTRTDCDIWAFNEAISNKTLPRADAVFQMHAPVIWRNPANRNDPKHYAWLQSQTDCSVVMQDEYPDVPRSVRYPLEAVQALTGGADFLTSSIALAIALATLYEYKRIEIYGVAMETNTEYQYQRDGVAFWIGFAKGRGIKVLFASPTFDAPVYGYGGEVVLPDGVFGERITELQPAVATLTQGYITAKVNLDKAIEAFLHVDNSKDLYAAVEMLVRAGEELGKADGAMQENKRYLNRAATMKEASGSFLFSRQEFESAAANTQKLALRAHTAFVAYGGQLALVHANVAKAAKGSPKRSKMIGEYRVLLQKYLETNNRMALLNGAMAENYAYMARLDKGIRAAGGEKSEAVMLERMQDALVDA